MAIGGFRFAAAVLFLTVLSVIISPAISHAKVKHDIIGKFVSISNNASVGTLGSVVMEPASRGDDVRVGDNIKTRSGETALLELVDGTRIAVFENTTVRISEFAMDTSVGERKVMILLFKGRISTFIMGMQNIASDNSKKVWNNSLVGVETKTGFVKTRRAIFSVEIDADNMTTLSVGSGEVTFKNVKPAVRGEMTVSENQVSKVTKYEPPTVPDDIAPEKMEDVLGGFFLEFIDDSAKEDVIVGGKKEAFSPPVVEKKEEKGSWQKPAVETPAAETPAAEEAPAAAETPAAEEAPAAADETQPGEAADAPVEDATIGDEILPEDTKDLLIEQGN